VPELHTQDWRDQYDQLRNKYQKLYTQRMPVLKNYEQMVNTSLSDLLGETMPQAKQYFDQARQIGDFTSKELIPGTEEYMKSAREYDTPERQAEASGRAMSDVFTAGDAARTSALERLEGYGIDPSVTRNASLDRNARLQTALEAVKQGRDAATGVEERGRAYQSEALGRGAQLQQSGLQAGQLGGGMMTSGLNAANQVGNTWANIFGTPQENIEAQKGLISASLQSKEAEVNSKLANKLGKGPGVAGIIGQTAGTALGAGVGLAASGGNPMGAMYGAQMGGQIGGSLSGAGGQQQQMGGPPPGVQFNQGNIY
jgi:hypothetical protein